MIHKENSERLQLNNDGNWDKIMRCTSNFNIVWGTLHAGLVGSL